MDSYEILRSVHKMGHPMVGTVIGHDIYAIGDHLTGCNIELDTGSPYKSILHYTSLFDEETPFDPALIPPKGTQLDLVVVNHSENTLYLSAQPKHLDPARIKNFVDFYALIEEIEVGTQLSGIVKGVAPFGIFVDLGLPFPGLIDVGHSSFNGGKQLDRDYSKWPQVGDEIKCVVGYFRLHDPAFGLGYLG